MLLLLLESNSLRKLTGDKIILVKQSFIKKECVRIFLADELGGIVVSAPDL